MFSLSNRGAQRLLLVVAVLAVLAVSAFAQTGTNGVTYPTTGGLTSAEVSSLGTGAFTDIRGAVVGVAGSAMALFALIFGIKMVPRLFKNFAGKG